MRTTRTATQQHRLLLIQLETIHAHHRKLQHLERGAIEAALRSAALAEAAGGFEMDLSHTVFYGICRDCREGGAQ